MTFEDIGIKVKQGVRVFSIPCPQCSKDRKKKSAPCLRVWNIPENRHFKCYHCGWSGNIDNMEKYKKVHENSKLPVRQQAYSIEMRDYLKKRGISTKTAKLLQLAEIQQYNKPILAWPVYMNLTLVNVKYLNIRYKKGDKFSKWHQLPRDVGTRIIPIGMQLLKTHDEDGYKIKNSILIICEGEIEMATWIECGYSNVISTPQGAPNPNTKNFDKEFEYINDKYVQSVIADFDLVYLAADNDENGRFLTQQLGMIIGKEKCRIVKFPVGYKDINEVFMGHEEKKLKPLGKEGVDGCYQNIVSFPIKGIIKAADVKEEIKIYREDGFLPGIKCGIDEVDKHITLKKKLLYEFVGIPGSGKSVWIRWYLIKLVQNNPDLNLKFAMFSPESRPVSREYAMIAQALTGKSIRKEGHNSMNEEMYRKAMNFVDKHFFIIQPDRYNFEDFDKKITKDRINTLDSIFKYVSYLKKTEDIYGFVIDPWNKVEHEKTRYESESEFAGRELDRIIEFAKYYDVAAIIMVHPFKMENVGENFKMPTLYSAKGSSAFFERADIGGIIHRNKMKRKKNGDIPDDADEDDKWDIVKNAPCIIKIAKHKFEEIGEEGKFKMELNSYQFFIYESEKKAPKKDIGDPDKFVEPTIFDEMDEEDDMPF